MLGLINRSIQNFLSDTHGEDVWQSVARRAGVGSTRYEPMLQYKDALTQHLIDAAATELKRPRIELLEDLGTYLSAREPVRRLLRYGGSDYSGFLRSLDDLRDRAHMALPDLDLPKLKLFPYGDGQYWLRVTAPTPGWDGVFAGLLRGMADDYGTLALIEVEGANGSAGVRIQLLDASHAQARGFTLAQAAQP